MGQSKEDASRGLVVASPLATGETGAMNREFESRQCIFQDF